MSEELEGRLRQMWAATDYTPIATRETLVSELLVQAVDVHAGERVLDVAAGTGNTAMSAARRGGVVTASDLAPVNLERAARRAEAEGLELRYEVADAQKLPFEDDSFDVVLSSFGVMYAPDHERAAAELLRVCRPGGRFGIVSWGQGLFGALQRTFAANLPSAARARPTGPVPASWGDEQYCRELFGDRVREFKATPRTHEFCHTSARAQAEFFRDHLPPFRATYRALDPETQWWLLDAVADVFESFNRATDGTLVARADYLEVVATVA